MNDPKYKEAIRTIKDLIKKVEPECSNKKNWEKKLQSSWAKFKRNPEEAPPDISFYDPVMRATLFYIAIAHSRGHLHVRRVGHWFLYDAKTAAEQINTYDAPEDPEEALIWQRRGAESMLAHCALMLLLRNRDPEGRRKWAVLSEDEVDLVSYLLDIGDQLYLSDFE